jgi:hypothetical protein
MVFPASGAGRVLTGIAIISVMLVPNPGLAKQAVPGEAAEIARCIRVAARGRSWLEKTLWGLRTQEAGWLGAEIANANGTHDLGPLQINSSWVPKMSRLLERPQEQVRHWLRYDPCFNVEAARWIFLTGLETSGDYWKAVGVYHSPTEWRQRAYAKKVASHMRRQFGPDVFAASRGNLVR